MNSSRKPFQLIEWHGSLKEEQEKVQKSHWTKCIFFFLFLSLPFLSFSLLSIRTTTVLNQEQWLKRETETDARCPHRKKSRRDPGCDTNVNDKENGIEKTGDGKRKKKGRNVLLLILTGKVQHLLIFPSLPFQHPSFILLSCPIPVPCITVHFDSYKSWHRLGVWVSIVNFLSNQMRVRVREREIKESEGERDKGEWERKKSNWL